MTLNIGSPCSANDGSFLLVLDVVEGCDNDEDDDRAQEALPSENKYGTQYCKRLAALHTCIESILLLIITTLERIVVLGGA